MKNETFSITPKGKICKRCKQALKFKDHLVYLGTFKDGAIALEGKEDGDAWFHFRCYIEWWQQSLKNKAMQLVDENVKKTMQQMPEIIRQFNDGISIIPEDRTS